MTATFLVGDVRERMAQLEDGSFDLILCSPPFLALRSYLPDGHPDKALEIGSEGTPAEFLDVLLDLTAEWGRLLAPHGSLAVELGDTYADSGGAGGDYNADGLRAEQPMFRQSRQNRDDWPLPKSLCGIPGAYQLSLAYGYNVLRRNAPDSPAGKWRIRNKKPWIRSNPPVGALGDKERPATSYVVVATRARDRFFDIDAVRTVPSRPREGTTRHKVRNDVTPGTKRGSDLGEFEQNNPAGAPPRDWWHHVDAVIDACLDNMAGKPNNANRNGSGGGHHGRSGEDGTTRLSTSTGGNVGARGVHIRRALEAAGILTTLDALDVSPTGYSGAHYAVWPKQLVRLLIDEMCPRRVCATCGQPSRRITETRLVTDDGTPTEQALTYAEGTRNTKGNYRPGHVHNDVTTVAWSDCACPDEWECDFCKGRGNHPNFVRHARSCHALDPTFTKINHWRPGRILDPFVGSGTTLEVATGMGRDAIGIDIDERNAELARQRCGMFLDIDDPTTKGAA